MMDGSPPVVPRLSDSDIESIIVRGLEALPLAGKRVLILIFTNWLGALITSIEIIGTQDTPVRQVIDRVAALIPTPRHALCSVVTHDGVAGLFAGVPEAAWAEAAGLSAQIHIKKRRCGSASASRTGPAGPTDCRPRRSGNTPAARARPAHSPTGRR